ncbi:MAG: hypothetical protein WD960_02850 [Gemmatimonadota bacterium]
MKVHPESGESPPIPGRWLPDAQPTESAAEWDGTVARILAAAEPTLQGLDSRGRRRAGGGWRDIGSLWKPAAALATAAMALLFAADPPEPAGTGSTGSFPLDLVVIGGDPPALWGAAGEGGDLVLAFIALQGTQAGPGGNGAAATSGAEEQR